MNCTNIPKKYHMQRKYDTEVFFNRVITGSLLYLSCKTRPELCFVLNSERRRMPNQQDLINIKKFRYLNGRIKTGIIYTETQKDLVLNVNSDSDHARDMRDRKSTSGYILMLLNGPLTCSKLKETIRSSLIVNESWIHWFSPFFITN